MAAIRRREHVRVTVSSRPEIAVGFWLLATCLLAQGQESEIVVNAGRYGPYFHLRYELTSESIDFSQSDREASPGGQFEVRLRPEHFPVPAPNCRGLLILRMPWTPPDLPDAGGKVEVKRKLLEQILALEARTGASVTVVVELNPYVEVIDPDPLRLRLTRCNIFFRNAAGAYVDHIGPLRPPNSDSG